MQISLSHQIWKNGHVAGKARFEARTQTVCLVGTGLAQTKRSSGTGDQSLADPAGGSQKYHITKIVEI